MPYIPWAEYGICKFWMLKRCYTGESCPWAHPNPAERKRLWDEKTAEQDAAAARGIPRPVNPRFFTGESRARDDDALKGHEGDAKHATRRMLPPPPSPLAKPPSPLSPSVQAPMWIEDAAHMTGANGLPASFSNRGSDKPTYGEFARDPRTSPGRVPEVAVLDAPESPSAMKPNAATISPGKQFPLDDAVVGDAAHHFEGARTGEIKKVAAGVVRRWKQQGIIPGSPMTKGDETAVVEADHMTDDQPHQNDNWTLYRKRRDAMSGKEEAGEVRTKKSPKRKVPPPQTPSRLSPVEKAARTLGETASRKKKMGATKRLSNGEVKHVGPHPSTIRVSARYASQASVEKRLQPQPATSTQSAPDVQERLTAEAREDSIRLQGCRWIDDVRRQMQLPIRTYTTACTYYHKFRLAHPQHVAGMEYGNAWADACAASLLTACKVEDTLKKSKDILAAAHNLRAATTGGEQLGTDDAMFEAPSRVVIGLERLVLEAGSFDFRSKYPHELMVKIAKTLDGDEDEKRAVTSLAWSVLTDLHRTFAPLKQTSSTMAIASLELASHLYATTMPNDTSTIRDSFASFPFPAHATTRDEVMETILDALDLYTHHTLQTLLGPKYGLDDYLRIRLAFNKECSEHGIARHTLATPRESEQESTSTTLRVQNGHPTPVSPPQSDTQTQAQTQQQANGQSSPEAGGTLRFMLNPQLAADEKADVQKFFVEEWEEYEEEIEVPIPRVPSPERGSERRPPLAGPPRATPPGPPRGEYRGGMSRYDDRRGPPPPRYDDRRYDDRRYEDRRGGRYDDRRYDDRRRW